MRLWALLGGLLILVFAIGAGSPSAALADPLYDIDARWGDTNLPPGGEAEFVVQARNVGDEVGAEELTVEDELPAGVVVKEIEFRLGPNPGLESACSGVGTGLATCSLSPAQLPELAPAPGGLAAFFSPAPTGYLPTMYVEVEIEAGASGVGTNTATLTGGGAPTALTDVDRVPFGSAPARFGIVPGSFEADLFDGVYPSGSPLRQAGDRPAEVRIDFDLTRKVGPAETAFSPPGVKVNRPHGKIKTVEVTLPRGMVGNPEATPKCKAVDFAEAGATLLSTACPAVTQVGYIDLLASELTFLTRIPLYNLEPPRGQVADLAFNASGLVQAHIYPNADPGQNYALKASIPNISNLVDILGSEVTLWGVPGDPAHDKFRTYPKVTQGMALGAPWGSAPIKPLLTNPADCGFDNGGARIRIDSYQHPGELTPVQEYEDPLNVSGCGDPRFRFEPKISMQPTSRAAGAPTGLAVRLEVPQRDDEVDEAAKLYAQNGNVKAIPTPPLKRAVVTFPAGMTVNPSATQGLSSCTPAQIGIGTDQPVICPDSSQFGTLSMQTPILPPDAQLEGRIYVAEPFQNPSHSFLSLYLVVQEPERGILAKLPGKVDLDPQTGQIVFTFDDLPQLPLEAATVSIKGGLRAGLVNPQTCGTKTIEADFYSWQEPQVPRHVQSHYEVTRNPDGSPCHQSLSERPFEPTLSGGTLNNLAGSYSPTEIELTRADADQELAAVEGKGPPGLLASVKGAGRCSNAAIATAGNPERKGTEELENPSCPKDSQVGTLDVGAGVGQVLTYVPGKVYLAGPYRGAPLSGVAVVPAVSGPFDLGTIVSRAPAYVEPKSGQLHVKTDPLPQVFKGVPLRVREIRVHLDKEHFTLNPTSCKPMRLEGQMFSSEGKSKAGGSPFQAAECSSLRFRPRLSVGLLGSPTRGIHPKFKGTYRPRPGNANLSAATITLPRSAFLDQSHIRTVCTRVQFAAKSCPEASIYGHAEAKTPLLEETLKGPVYLRSSDHKLPDLVADLHGIVDVEVAGRIDSERGGIRASFESIPDVPVSSFAIAMQGGRKGLLVNSRDLCAHQYRLKAELSAHSGRARTLRPKMRARCKHERRARERGDRP